MQNYNEHATLEHMLLNSCVDISDGMDSISSELASIKLIAEL